MAYPKRDWSGRSRQDGGTAHEAGAGRQRRQAAPSWAASPSAAAQRPAVAAHGCGSSPPLDQEPGTLAPIRLLHTKGKKRQNFLASRIPQSFNQFRRFLCRKYGD